MAKEYVDGEPISGSFDKASQVLMDDGSTVQEKLDELNLKTKKVTLIATGRQIIQGQVITLPENVRNFRTIEICYSYASNGYKFTRTFVPENITIYLKDEYSNNYAFVTITDTQFNPTVVSGNMHLLTVYGIK